MPIVQSPSTRRLLELLGTRLPLIQAPMAGVQGSALALAVSNAGGLGSLPGAMLTPEALEREIEAIQAGTANPFNVNFFCHTPPTPDASAEAAWRQLLAPAHAAFGVDVSQLPAGPGRLPFSEAALAVLERRRPVRVVSFHFGLPAAELLGRVKALGAVVLASATTVQEALWLEAHGADAIIAQGVEAGGHRGVFLGDWRVELAHQPGLFALLPQVVAAVRLPVIAAGGIADAPGVAAAMALGAAGVQVGTAYLLCPEATTSKVHRAALDKARSDPGSAQTALTNLFTGRPARGLVNRVMRELGPINPVAPPFPLATNAIAPLRAAAEAMGSGDYSPLWSGQNPSGCKPVPAADLTRELAQGFDLHPS